jgi:serine/threonine protein kinase
MNSIDIYMYICQSKTYFWCFNNFFSGQFWTAPEHLSMAYELKYGSQKGDVYSIGIIHYEILFRSQPYDTDTYLPEGKTVLQEYIKQSYGLYVRNYFSLSNCMIFIISYCLCVFLLILTNVQQIDNQAYRCRLSGASGSTRFSFS